MGALIAKNSIMGMIALFVFGLCLIKLDLLPQ